MSSNYVCYNNKFYAEEQPIFGINRAMKFGDGVFETIRVINGKPRYLSFHLERLRKGLDVLEISYLKSDLNNLEVALSQLLIKNEIDKGGIIRIIAHRSGLGKYTPETNQVVFYLETERLDINLYTLNKKGLSLGVSRKVFITPTVFSGLKTLNSLPYILASKEKSQAKEDELILLNSVGQIAEVTSSNIFLVIKGVVYTPPLKSGCLDGVMRRVIINKLKSNNIQVSLQMLKPEDLLIASEIFISNSVCGVQWISSYHSKRYFKKITAQLIEWI